MAKKPPAKKSSSKSAPGKTAPKKAASKKAPSGKATVKSTGKSPTKKIVKKKTTPVKKTATAKTTAPVKKAKTVKKAAKKAPIRKAVTKKAAKRKVPNRVTSKPAPAKKTPSKTAAPKPAKKSVKKPVVTTDSSVDMPTAVKKKSPRATAKTRTGKSEGQTSTKTKAATNIRPTSSMRGRVKAARRSAFTLDDVREVAKRNEKNESKAQPKTVPVEKSSTTVISDLDDIPQEKRVLGAASLADILGFDPNSKTPREDEEKRVPKKHIRYYRLLVELREHVNSELTLHTEDTLKRSSKEDSGDLSGYGQHIADVGTDTFDRDFALSLVSSEQEALHEVEEAINRIKTGTFGICELTGKPISKERLLAVPFARYSVESQAQMEKSTRRNVQRGGIFADATAEDGARFVDDDSDS